MEEEQETFQGNGQRLTANEKQTQVASFPGPSGIPSIDYVFLSVRGVSYSFLTILQAPGAILSANAITANRATLWKLLHTRELSARERSSALNYYWTIGFAGSISGYFKLLSRCGVPIGRETSRNVSLGKFRPPDRKLIRPGRVRIQENVNERDEPEICCDSEVLL